MCTALVYCKNIPSDVDIGIHAGNIVLYPFGLTSGTSIGYVSCSCINRASVERRPFHGLVTRHMPDTRLEIDPIRLLPGYPVGIPGRTLPVQRLGSGLNTRGFSEPAGDDVTGTLVPHGGTK